ncbi:MFS transporter [Clostridium polynesiense]|uniref:MFS transporter n=1 Tax=Clostridium polynesiense TaxID=1325933 RepID=UPI000694E868|nr:MFS transporter [Clostridium polynesiense]
MKKQITLKYAILQGNYWMIFCSVVVYASVFLLSKEFSASEIGILIAWANVFSVVLQPVIADFADKSKKITLQKLSALIAAGGLVPLVILLFIPNVKVAVAGLFAIVITAAGVLMPLINSISVYYENKGYNVNYGLARGIGSLSFAVLSYILGYLIKIKGENIVLIAALTLYALIILVLIMFKMNTGEEAHENNENISSNKGKNFFRQYKRFTLMLIGVVCLFAFHNMINTYLVQIMAHVGGDSEDMGKSIAIAAMCELPAMFLFSKVVRKISADRLLKISGVFFTIKSVAFYFAGSVMMIHVSQLLQALSFALYIPASVYYANEVMKEEHKIKGQALLTAALTAGGVVGNLLGGYIIDYRGVSMMLLWCILFSVSGMFIFFVTAEGEPRAEVGSQK